MSYLIKIDNYLHSLKIGKNAAVDSWLLMSGPLPITAIIILYLVFVLRLGPALMSRRPPLKLTNLILLYNAVQVLLSAVVCYKCIRLNLFKDGILLAGCSYPSRVAAALWGYDWCIRLNLFKDGILLAGCSYPSSTQDLQLSDCGWWYFFAKVTELLDTVFFALRKKQTQITFLHVYHHAVMVAFAWSYLKFAAGGQGAVLGLMNSSVHVVMYTYYLLAALGPAYEKYLWWKKYVTTMQMTQFVLMVSYCMFTNFAPTCHFPKSFTYFITANIVLFFALFLHFYIKNYKMGSKSQKELKLSLKIGSSINGNENKSNGYPKLNGNGNTISYEKEEVILLEPKREHQNEKLLSRRLNGYRQTTD